MSGAETVILGLLVGMTVIWIAWIIAGGLDL